MAGESWETILGSYGVTGPPVRGKPSEFESARSSFDSMYTHADDVYSTFKTITSEGVPEDRLNNQPAETLRTTFEGVDEGLADLPRIAREARDIFADHIEKLNDLRERADEALGRARTAWSNKQSAQSAVDNADEDADDIGDLNDDLDSANSALETIYYDDYLGLVREEASLNENTIDALDDIDRGNLDDPNWLEKVVSAIGNFVGGILENIAMLVEGLLTGDLGKILWALNGLLDAALLILGTIALFTGVGAPLFFLAVGAVAVKAVLAATQMPNPQTGETMSWVDVGISALGAALGAGGAIRAFSTMRTVGGYGRFSSAMRFSRVTTTGRAANGRFTSVLGGRGPGGIRSTIDNFNDVGRALRATFTNRTAFTSFKNLTGIGKYGSGFTRYGTTRFQRGLMYADATVTQLNTYRGHVGNLQKVFDIDLGTVGNKITGGGDLNSIATTGGTNNNIGSGYFNGDFNVFNADTPMPTPEQAREVVQQTVDAPNACIVPA